MSVILDLLIPGRKKKRLEAERKERERILEAVRQRDLERERIRAAGRPSVQSIKEAKPYYKAVTPRVDDTRRRRDDEDVASSTSFDTTSFLSAVSEDVPSRSYTPSPSVCSAPAPSYSSSYSSSSYSSCDSSSSYSSSDSGSCSSSCD